jgi:hypothetical protein
MTNDCPHPVEMTGVEMEVVPLMVVVVASPKRTERVFDISMIKTTSLRSFSYPKS